MSAGKVHALGGNRMTLLQVAAGTAYAKEFIEQAKAGGLVRQAIDRAELRGVNVAPRAPGM